MHSSMIIAAHNFTNLKHKFNQPQSLSLKSEATTLCIILTVIPSCISTTPIESYKRLLNPYFYNIIGFPTPPPAAPHAQHPTMLLQRHHLQLVHRP